MLDINLTLKEWSKLGKPGIDDEIRCPETSTGSVLLLDLEISYDYEADIAGHDVITAIRLNWCA